MRLGHYAMGQWNYLDSPWFGSRWFWEMRLKLTTQMTGELWEPAEIETAFERMGQDYKELRSQTKKTEFGFTINTLAGLWLGRIM